MNVLPSEDYLSPASHKSGQVEGFNVRLHVCGKLVEQSVNQHIHPCNPLCSRAEKSLCLYFVLLVTLWSSPSRSAILSHARCAGAQSCIALGKCFVLTRKISSTRPHGPTKPFGRCERGIGYRSGLAKIRVIADMLKVSRLKDLHYFSFERRNRTNFSDWQPLWYP